MKVLLLALFFGLIASQIISTRPPPYVFTLEFDHAARSAGPVETSPFLVEFNGIRLKEWKSTDYKVYHETFTVNAYPGKNIIRF
jgi:hypothetical protein